MAERPRGSGQPDPAVPVEWATEQRIQASQIGEGVADPPSRVVEVGGEVGHCRPGACHDRLTPRRRWRTRGSWPRRKPAFSSSTGGPRRRRPRGPGPGRPHRAARARRPSGGLALVRVDVHLHRTDPSVSVCLGPYSGNGHRPRRAERAGPPVGGHHGRPARPRPVVVGDRRLTWRELDQRAARPRPAAAWGRPDIRSRSSSTTARTQGPCTAFKLRRPAQRQPPLPGRRDRACSAAPMPRCRLRPHSPTGWPSGRGCGPARHRPGRRRQPARGRPPVRGPAGGERAAPRIRSRLGHPAALHGRYAETLRG